MLQDTKDGDDTVPAADPLPPGDRDSGATKRRRMQQLIQKSIDMASAHDAVSAAAAAAPSTNDTHTSTTSSSIGRSSTNAANAVQPPMRSKCTWSPEEDARLQALVKHLGFAQWAAVAAHFPGRNRKRCRERFVNHVDPHLRRRAWAADEESQLLALQRELGSRWAAIARRLRDRSPDEAKNRFLLWSTEEAKTLRTLVEAHGATNWLFIASHLPGRTDLQCMQQWRQVLDPAIVKGRGSWSAQEDALLAEKVEALGPKWTQIARLLPGRVGKQCRERYLNHLDPSIRKNPWTQEEDAKLQEACERHTNRWSHVAKEMPGRSANAVKNRWHTLTRRKLLCHSDDTSSKKPLS